MFAFFTYKNRYLTLPEMFLQTETFSSSLLPKLIGVVLLFDISHLSLSTLVGTYLFTDVDFMKWLVLTMGVDFVTGVTKVWVKEGYDKVTSRGMRDTVSKSVQYLSLIIGVHILTHFRIEGEVVFPQLQFCNRIVLEFLILIELKSIYENIIIISPRLDVVKKVMGEIRKFTERQKD